MRRTALLALFTAASCLLGGCDGFVQDSYLSVTPHEEVYDQTGPGDTVEAGTYEELKLAVRHMVEEHALQRSVDVSQYTGDLEKELKQAVQETRKEDPLTAYVVESAETSVAEVGARSVATISLSYRRTLQQVEAIENTWGVGGMEDKALQALEAGQTRLTLWVTGFGESNLPSLIRAYYQEHPERIMECPEVSVSVYPASGSTRIVELDFHYTTAPEQLLPMRQSVQVMLSSAAGYVRGQTDPQRKAQRLYTFLQPLLTETAVTATPIYSILCEGRGDSRSMAQAYQILCAQAGLECLVVEGTLDGEPWCWNILRLEDRSFHVDLTADWGGGELAERYDGDMYGYGWDPEQYPACQAPEPPPTESTVPEDTTEPETFP